MRCTDVKNGKIFYNNSGQQTGSAVFRSTKQTIYNVKAGNVDPTGYTGSPNYVAPTVINGTNYLIEGQLKTLNRYNAVPIYHITVDIKCEDIEYIKFGSQVFKIIAGGKSDGTSTYSQFIVMYTSVGTMTMQSPNGSYDIFPSIKFGYASGRYDKFMSDIYLMFSRNETTTTNTKYIISDNIPIVISQYVD